MLFLSGEEWWQLLAVGACTAQLPTTITWIIGIYKGLCAGEEKCKEKEKVFCSCVCSKNFLRLLSSSAVKEVPDFWNAAFSFFCSKPGDAALDLPIVLMFGVFLVFLHTQFFFTVLGDLDYLTVLAGKDFTYFYFSALITRFFSAKLHFRCEVSLNFLMF